ncbi:PD-(D/E)XK nuclease family protein [Aliikangiella maris]|uniref:PD-(D/E)XK nuclease family protein n=2 Tax=Aliikangiella maris TaxID=3162458 RepID=A0ABV2BW04_9GAMM
MPLTISFAKVAQYIDNDSLILTPNSRTQKAFIAGAVNHLREGEVIYSPKVMSFSQWQDELWDELSFTRPLPRLVSRLALKIWMKSQIANEEHWQLTNLLGVAEKVIDAYQILHQWDLSIDAISETPTLESQYFVRWIELLEQFLKEKKLLAQISRLNYLYDQRHELSRLIPQKIILLGFNQLTPIESKWLAFCQQRGSECIEIYPQREVKRWQRVELLDLKQELQFAAQNAANNLRQNSQQSIGIVVNQLANHLGLVHQIFSDVFQPEENLPWEPLYKVRYNVSAGQALIEMPLVSIAMKLLQLKSDGIDLATLMLIKNTPFIHWGEHAFVIKQFLHQQSLQSYTFYSFERLVSAIQTHAQCDKLNLLYKRLVEVQQRSRQAKPVTVWIDVWRDILKKWGWMEQMILTESEQKQLTEFYQTLTQMSALLSLYAKSTQSEAIEFFQQLLQQAPFQLPSDRTNVHVLGVLEAAGLEFEQLILVGFDKNNWPQKASPNPFLPIELQQRYQMPGSSAEKEYRYALELSQSLLNSADDIWVTQSAEEESSDCCSPFFKMIPLVDSFAMSQNLAGALQLTTDYQWYKEDNLQLGVGDISGGAYLLSEYAACPFKAMGHFHFNLQLPQTLRSGIDAKIKGAWLHQTMELIWQTLQTHDALMSLSELALEDLIKNCLKQTQQQLNAQLHALAPPKVIELEFTRLYQLILQWFKIEKQRAPFTVETEVGKTLTLGPLKFSFRIDRIDYLDDGSIEIIDYKTGQSHFKKWLGSRPEEAQMPAYVLACENEKITSLTYAKLRTGEVQQAGIWFDKENQRFLEVGIEETKDKTRWYSGDPKLISPDVPLVEQWQKTLTSLASRIASGEMPVSPKNQLESCQFCELVDFCRINEEQPDESLHDDNRKSALSPYSSQNSEVAVRNNNES